MKIKKFKEYFLNEDDGGGGVGFTTLNGNGMGNIVTPTIGNIPGSFNQNGSGYVGSGDIANLSGTYLKTYYKLKKKKKRKLKTKKI